MIAERSVVWVFLNGHNLDCIITVGCYTRQDEVAEFSVCADTLSFLCHADMAFIDHERTSVGAETAHFPFVRFRRPYLSRENFGLFVLNHAGRVGGNSFALSAVPADHHLVEVAVVDVVRLQLYFPDTIFLWLKGIFLHDLPFGKIADKSDCSGIRCPFAEHPSSVGCVVKTEEVMGVCKAFKSAVRPAELSFFV